MTLINRIIFICFFLLIYPLSLFSQSVRMLPEVTPAGKGKVNTMVDNIGYWSRMVQLGYVKASPKTIVPPARFNGSTINEYNPPSDSRHSSFVTRHSYKTPPTFPLPAKPTLRRVKIQSSSILRMKTLY